MLNWSCRRAPPSRHSVAPGGGQRKATWPAVERQVLKRRLRASYAPNQGASVVNHRARAWMELAVAFALFVAAVVLVLLIVRKVSGY